MTPAASPGPRPIPKRCSQHPRSSADRRADGSIIVKSTVPLGAANRAIGEWLERWAGETPDKVFLGERTDTRAAWSTITYREMLARVRAAASWMIGQRLSAQRPLAILSDNAIEHAIFALGAMHAGVPVATISSAYSLVSKDFEKLNAAVKLLDPGAIYVSDALPFGPALAAIKASHRAIVVAGKNAEAAGGLPAAEVLATPDSDSVTRAFAAITPQTIAKFLFTSGSTGAPKAVINTHGMLTSNQAAKAQVWPFLERSELVVLDWLPWSHTFGANHNFNMVLRNGGTLYIDAGKPAPGLFNASLDNLRSVIPTVYFNVPRGFDMLIGALRDDAALRRKFFENVRFAFYAAAALPQTAWDSLEELSVATTGRAIPMVSAWGSTETSPLATDCHFLAGRPGNIGVPVPGTELKLVPSGEKLEVRVRGANVTPGYWKAPELTAQAFDEEGFYRIGDAVKFADAERPERGLFFDGRISEDFKLSSGTWVSGRHAARRRGGGTCAIGAGHRRRRARRGRGAFPRVSEHRRLPRSLRLAGHATLTDVLAHAKVRAGDRDWVGKAEGAERRFVGSRHPRAAARRAALDRRRRDHRQGLHQPARRARPACGCAGEAAR